MQFRGGKIITEVMDYGDVSYRSCKEVSQKNTEWGKYYFGLASKNYKDTRRPSDMETDVDIHMIRFSLRPVQDADCTYA